ncbi:hypothetical protein [Paracoccus sediminicola]|uniref:hypothetical protein n=1 Tax=Paracoccus sediminicola TaxID=3017783 RepID=UPI0022F0B5D1|nr:hypothetical protein [Paracoccus sediminicola]WBU57260.1 hypothetical protein PAF18_02090 [Paracoccus sediminicola]
MAGADGVEIRGAKHRALISLLATAPLGRRTRSFLQHTLWGDAGYDSGHQNLRRALSDLRKILGEDFDRILHITSTDVEIDLDALRFTGDPHRGAFLEDLNVQTPAFAAWRQKLRDNPAGAATLCARGAITQSPKPRITALPLSVLGEDPQLRAFGDWVAEEICRVLSRSSLYSVISHLSARAMVQRMIDLADVRDTLDVDYMITGTIRRYRGDCVLDFDFLDARSGVIVWNRHFSCPEDSFTDELPERLINVVVSAGRTIADAAIGHIRDKRLGDIADHQLVLGGVSLMHRPALRDFLRSQELLIEAAERMPQAPEVHAWLGKWYVLNVFKNYTTNRKRDTQLALDCTERALDLDPTSSFGLTINGFVHGNLLKRLDVAEARYCAALEVNPNESLSWLLRGTLLAFRDNGQAAIEATDTARRLSPIDPFGYYYDSLSASAHLAAEDYPRALALADQSLQVNDRHLSTLRTQIAAMYFLDDIEGCRQAAETLRRRFPEFRLDSYGRDHPGAGSKTGQRVLEALRASGIR